VSGRHWWWKGTSMAIIFSKYLKDVLSKTRYGEAINTVKKMDAEVQKTLAMKPPLQQQLAGLEASLGVERLVTMGTGKMGTGKFVDWPGTPLSINPQSFYDYLTTGTGRLIMKTDTEAPRGQEILLRVVKARNGQVVFASLVENNVGNVWLVPEGASLADILIQAIADLKV
jgi:hypothetical protein